MEDIYSYILVQRHKLESEYYKLKTENSDLNNFKIEEAQTYYENILKQLEESNQELNLINEAKIKSKNPTPNPSQNPSPTQNNLYLSLEEIKHILDTDTYDYDKIYGVLNYFEAPTNKQSNLKLIKYLTDNKYEFHNKQTIISKLIKNAKPTDEFTSDAYGVLFFYEKTEDEINPINKVYLLKNANINSLNSTNNDATNSENSDTETETDQEKIITKIYQIESKIMLKDIIYESNYEDIQREIEQLELEQLKLANPTNPTELSETEISLLIRIDNLNILKNRLGSFDKQLKTYKKYIEENVKSPDTKSFLNNFSFIKTYIKKTSDPSKQILNINNLLKLDFADKFTRLKLFPRLDKSEYDNIIETYYDESLEDICQIILDNHNLGQKLSEAMENVIEILSRMYIDEHLGFKTYCLSKQLSEYLNISSVGPEPDSSSDSLKRRHWANLIQQDDQTKLVVSILLLLNSKTHTLEKTLQHFEKIFNDVHPNLIKY